MRDPVHLVLGLAYAETPPVMSQASGLRMSFTVNATRQVRWSHSAPTRAGRAMCPKTLPASVRRRHVPTRAHRAAFAEMHLDGKLEP